MHFVYTQGSLPFPGDNGISMMGWSLIKHGIRKGHKVTVIGLSPTEDHLCTPEGEKLIRSLGANLTVLRFEPKKSPAGSRLKRLGNVFSKIPFDDVYPWAVLRQDLERTLASVAPDVVIALHHEPLAALMGIKSPPVLGIMGDPTHLPAWFRWRYVQSRHLPTFFRAAPGMFRTWRDVPGYDVDLLNNVAQPGALAAHYARWYEEKGVKDCRYYRVPMSDEIGAAWKEAREKRRLKTGPKKITLLGALHGTATRVGLRFLATDVLPKLSRVASKLPLEVHVFGRGDIPPEARGLLDFSFVKRRGYVEDIGAEMASTDVFLVPTPITLGIRTRVLNAFSFGLNIVSHRANAAGVPELEHNRNSLLSNSGAEMAEHIEQALTDTALQQRLSDAARQTYDAFFSEEVAAERVLSDAQRLVRN